MTHEALNWIDRHPRTGWYICVVVTMNFLLEVGAFELLWRLIV